MFSADQRKNSVDCDDNVVIFFIDKKIISKYVTFQEYFNLITEHKLCICIYNLKNKKYIDTYIN